MKQKKGFTLIEVVIILAIIVMIAAIAIPAISSLSDDARVASRNLSKAADNFEISRRIVFYNGITGEYMLNIEGLCSVENNSKRLAVTCKTSEDSYKKHYLGLSDNVTYFSEQVEASKVSIYRYRVVFKPEVIIPNVDIKTSIDE